VCARACNVYAGVSPRPAATPAAVAVTTQQTSASVEPAQTTSHAAIARSEPHIAGDTGAPSMTSEPTSKKEQAKKEKSAKSKATPLADACVYVL
jgi:hypothetical protein